MKTSIASCIFLALLVSSLSAQSVLISGQLLDKDTDEAIPYASLRVAGTGVGTVSNILGEFSLSIPISSIHQRLQISCLGYADQEIPLSSFREAEKKIILLKEQTFTLDEVVIYSTDVTAKELLELAFEHVKDNYPQKGYLLNTFYRHYCKEGNVYGRLIEAAIDLYDKKGYRKPVKNPSKKFGVKFKQLRRSVDFTSISGFSHSAHALPVVLRMDVVGYKNFQVFAEKEPKNIDFFFEDTTYFQGEVVYVVRAESKKPSYHHTMDFYISADNFAILRYEQVSNSSHTFKSTTTSWKGKHVFNYQLYQGKYYLEHSLDEARRITQERDSLGQIIHTSDHFHHVELMVNEIQTQHFQKVDGEMPTESTLAAIPYDPNFWNNYTVLQATPLEQGIKQDLEARISLEDQFSGDDRTGQLSEIQDELMSQKLERMLTINTNQPTLLCFWDSHYKPGLKELLFARKLAKEYGETDIRVRLIFISLDRNEADWDAAIRKYRLYAGQHMRLAKGVNAGIARKYGVTGSPYFVLMDKRQNIIIQGAELPKRSHIDDLMGRLGD
ncbi:MAG: carboxypeptidase-like regulatory domain-containing protein [Bacteroidota bacterium]